MEHKQIFSLAGSPFMREKEQLGTVDESEVESCLASVVQTPQETESGEERRTPI